MQSAEGSVQNVAKKALDSEKDSKRNAIEAVTQPMEKAIFAAR